MFTLSANSKLKLIGVHPALVAVVERAITLTSVDFMVTEGLRTKDRQAKLVAAGASQTMHSKHLRGRAVDLAAKIDGEVRWDWPLYHEIARAMKQAAEDLGVPIIWGGDWHTFKDGPHFELPDSFHETSA